MTTSELSPRYSRTESDRKRAIRFIKYLLFSASIIPSLVAGAMAFGMGRFEWLPWTLAAAALLIGQAGGDYLYYYFSHFRGESRDSHTKIFAGWMPLFTGTALKPRHTIYAGAACLLADLAIGVYFYLKLGPPIIWLALAGGTVAVFFTPLMLKGLKEPVVFMTFGPLCVFSIYFVLTQDYSWVPLIVSLPIGLFITLVAYLKGARFQVKEDHGDIYIHNLKTRTVLGLLVLAYTSLVVGVLLKAINSWALLATLTLPFSFYLVRMLSGRNRISDYLWATVLSLVISIMAGLMIALSFILP
jgi:1,4-dihydroxy-2-naphthoate octaprenyltransferase